MSSKSMSLDSIGIRAGTDKSRLRQDYLRHYERMMAGLRERPIVLLEIGIHNGASLRVWETYFPSATIVGVDIEPKTREFARSRVHVEIGSQADAAFLARLAEKYKPDVVIDDGSHLDEHQIFTFEHLFHAVQPGGLYVVEDIGRGNGEWSAADYFGALQQDVLLRRVSAGKFPGSPLNRSLVSHVQAVPGAVAIWKRFDEPSDIDFESLERMAVQSELPESLFFLAQYIRRNRGPLSHALSVCQQAAAAAPSNPWMRLEISKLLMAMGDKEGAVKEGRAALSLATTTRGEAVFREYLQHISGG